MGIEWRCGSARSGTRRYGPVEVERERLESVALPASPRPGSPAGRRLVCVDGAGRQHPHGGGELDSYRIVVIGVILPLISAAWGPPAGHEIPAAANAITAPAAAERGRPSVPARVDTARVVEITATGVDLSYDVTRIEARAGERLTIRLVNASDMEHNVVLLRAEADVEPVGMAALRAAATDFIPEAERDRILVHSALARPGETVELTFEVPPPGEYPYICTYAAHFMTMRGTLISTE